MVKKLILSLATVACFGAQGFNNDNALGKWKIDDNKYELLDNGVTIRDGKQLQGKWTTIDGVLFIPQDTINYSEPQGYGSKLNPISHFAVKVIEYKGQGCARVTKVLAYGAILNSSVKENIERQMSNDSDLRMCRIKE